MLDSPVPQDAPPEFSIAVRPDGSHVVVAPSGDLDLSTVDDLARSLAAARTDGFDDVIVDLRGLTFIDSSGLGLLLSEARTAQAGGRRLRLIDGSDACRRLFDITGTRPAFTFVEGPAS